mmetsp:Transcript_10736/g.28160  ORF Transcript_10736/g.28160 Transcript_10736/m.28160 type:complete len:252 (-) Transcript_10736:532-1287(-)
MIISLSPTRTSSTRGAEPRALASKDSFPSRSAKVVISSPPVVLAILFKSSFLHLLTPIAPASTKAFIAISSMPFVVRTTFAPASSTSLIRCIVISSSFFLIASSFFGSSITMLTPMLVLYFLKSQSRRAIRAFSTCLGICWEARVQLTAYPLMNSESRGDLPWLFKMLIALIGYLALPVNSLTVFTLRTASTAISAKKLSERPIILELREVFATLRRHSRPKFSTGVERFSSTYLQAWRIAILYPRIMLVG